MKASATKKVSSDKLDSPKIQPPKLLSEGAPDTPKKKIKKLKQSIEKVAASKASPKSSSPAPGYAPLPPSPDMAKIKMKA